jgi:hypothetical protein
MTESEKPPVSKLMIFGFIVMGVAAFSGLGALITLAIQKVSSGHGLDTYRTVWLVEFNYVGLLVMFGERCCRLRLFGTVCGDEARGFPEDDHSE